MRLVRSVLVLLATLTTAGWVAAQSTSGTISGRVADAQGGVLPGVTISVESPNLQGVRTAVTTESGDYVVPLLPSGSYTLTFELSSFERQQRVVFLAPTQVVPLDVTLGIAGVQESVIIRAPAAEVLTRTSQVALNLKQDLIATLPNNRDIMAAVLLAPSVHSTGAAGGISIAGSMSFQNLFMVNGVTINENLRGIPLPLFIEDAVQETTVATGGVSAEFGRFSGGVVNVITKSGGNTYSGSFRETFNNDKWRTLTPFEEAVLARPTGNDARLDDVVPQHEYTFGGPIVKDRLWFFTAGRLQNQAERRTLVVTNIPYDFKRLNKRYEAKGTYTLTPKHRVQGSFIKIFDDEVNYTFRTTSSMDTNSLGTRKSPQDLSSLSYSGVISSKFFVEALWSNRNSASIGAGGKSQDLIAGTLLIDSLRNTRYWSDTFCGVCSPERRDNENVNLKATYFLSSDRIGTHSMTFGYDNFNDIRSANNYQSGSNYRIFGTTSLIRGAGNDQIVYPQFLNDGSTILAWQPIPVLSNGSNFRTHAAFYNDSWRLNDRVTANLGVRFDKNDGRDQEGKLVTTTSALSPRLSVIIDPRGDQKWSVSTGFSQFVDAIANSVADASSTAGNPQTYQYVYRGPSINANPSAATLVSSPDAIAQVLAWYDANGGPNQPTNGAPNLPGVSTKIGPDLRSPKVLEYTAGVNRQFSRAAVRVDYVFRDWRDVYVQRTDLSTGRVSNSLGQSFDVTLLGNTRDLTRRYSGVSAQGTYRFRGGDAGATYTLSRLWGTVDGEGAPGPTAASAFQYPEYKQAAWNYPVGDLAADQRHRARLWMNYNLPWVSGVTLSALQTLESGVPYGALGTVDPRSFVTNPGYLTPPPANQTVYYFTARDAFRTEGQKRLDFAASYRYGLKIGTRVTDLFIQAQVLNLFDNQQLCGCGGSVFQNGGAVNLGNIDQVVRTAASGSGLATFNPFTTTPVEGVNWARSANFGTALNRFGWTSPRQLRLTMGVRF
jgi:outer membrane receptor for ferrienterochelin and colicin